MDEAGTEAARCTRLDAQSPQWWGQGDPPWSLKREHISGPPDGGLLAPELGQLTPAARVKLLPSRQGALGQPRPSCL